MTRDELLIKLRELKPWLEEQGIVNARLFGSYARDEAGPDSDVDLLVETSGPWALSSGRSSACWATVWTKGWSLVRKATERI